MSQSNHLQHQAETWMAHNTRPSIHKQEAQTPRGMDEVIDEITNRNAHHRRALRKSELMAEGWTAQEAKRLAEQEEA